MKKMILDLDTGVDDALAISYALGSPEIELIGITGTYGNVLVEQGVRNALAVTDLLGHPEVKVYQGLPHSSTSKYCRSPRSSTATTASAMWKSPIPAVPSKPNLRSTSSSTQ